MSDVHWMGVALELARRGLGTTSPNPSVGAVLVKDGAVVGSGWTRPPGGPHAEIVALVDAARAGHDPRGATLYVTFEPCCHYGRTPPCTDAILAAGVARVVAGMVDPFPPMRGNGLEQLRRGGVEVVLGVREAECAQVVRGFCRAVTVGLPEVSCKVAMSLDGRIATQRGESRWITGPEARADGHRLRAEHDAILVGIGTVLADDPRLTCRVEPDRDPVPVVVDSRLRISADAALFRSSKRAIVFCGPDAPERELPAEVLRLPRKGEGLDLEAALRALVDRGMTRILVEGGAAIHRSLFDLGLVDSLHVYVAGVVVPGGIPWIGGPPLARLDTAPRLGAPDVRTLGEDVLLRYDVPHRAGELS